VNEHGHAELFNQVLDLCGVEGSLLLSWCGYRVALFVLLKATNIFKVVFKIVHCIRKCGVFLYRRAGELRLQRWD
jgi:hypothetical protein